MPTDLTTTTTPGRSIKNVPMWVWLLAGAGGIFGAVLSEPGAANTVGSVVTFSVAALIIGLAAWGITAAVRR